MSHQMNSLILAPISAQVLLFFLPRTKNQLAFKVRASAPSMLPFPITTPDLRQPASLTDTYIKSKPTQNRQNASAELGSELDRSPSNSLLRTRLLPAPSSFRQGFPIRSN